MATQTLDVPDLTESHPPPGQDADAPEPLFRHSRRPEWGFAVLAWESDGKRGYQFEDGNLRQIREGYYKLLEPVDEGEVAIDTIRDSLRSAVDARKSGSEHDVQKAVCAFTEQLTLFTKLYPEGFSDPAWIDEHRGSEEGNSLKRHRDPSLARARVVLDPTIAKELIDAGKQDELAKSILDVLAGTSLTPIAHVKTLRALDDEQTAEFAEAVFDLVHGAASFQDRFRSYISTLERLLGSHPSWRAATALTALAHPQEHVAVRRSAFLRQAGSIAPAEDYSRTPKAGAYENYRRVAVGVKKRLEAAGHAPVDLLDVHDFIWTTLRRSALDQLGTAKA